MHRPEQAVSQQIPSGEQVVPLAQPAATVWQVWPFLLLHAPVASHVPVQRPLGSSWLMAATQAWLVLQVWQVPAQSAFAQQADVAMHVVPEDEVHAFSPVGHVPFPSGGLSGKSGALSVAASGIEMSGVESGICGRSRAASSAPLAPPPEIMPPLAMPPVSTPPLADGLPATPPVASPPAVPPPLVLPPTTVIPPPEPPDPPSAMTLPPAPPLLATSRAPPFDDGPSITTVPPAAAPPPSTAPPPEPPDPAGPQLFLSLQQNGPPRAPLVAARHWYPEGQSSLILQGAFAPGGVAPLERQPVRAAEERKDRKERTQKTLDVVTE